jgi:hypothetical protein
MRRPGKQSSDTQQSLDAMADCFWREAVRLVEAEIAREAAPPPLKRVALILRVESKIQGARE